ncbi:MAG: hypothetical protein JO053_12045, partial [Acidobacteria bacterium]|nr:hypothetical protein [Acidobacteriota bacterium]
LGILRNASENLETFGSLERVQASRIDLARSAKSGFGSDVDVGTANGALSAVPIGFIYLMFAPFPWQVGSLRQTITLPEVVVWWATVPLVIVGIWYSIRHRLRSALPILLFTLTLTLSYSIFQGNVGTAYRQRTQIQVFLFVFAAVGWTVLKEKRSDRKLAAMARARSLDLAIRTRHTSS